MDAICLQLGKPIDGGCKYMHASVLGAVCVCVYARVGFGVMVVKSRYIHSETGKEKNTFFFLTICFDGMDDTDSCGVMETL